MSRGLARPALAELLGTLLLVTAVVGSGIAVAPAGTGDAGLPLVETALVTAGTLAAVILAVGPVSGAHLNPAVTLVDLAFGGVGRAAAAAYVVAQVAGGVAGTLLANAMFGLPAAEWSTTGRSSAGLWLGEAVATFGLVLVVFAVVRSGRVTAVAFAAGAYVAAACIFTSSTSFANPAVTLARTLTDTSAGIAPGSALGFLAAQLIGATLAAAAVRVLYPDIRATAARVVVPHESGPGKGVAA